MWQALFEVILLGIVPLVLVASGIVFGTRRFAVLFGSVVLMVAAIFIFQIPLGEIGWHPETVARALPWYIGFAAVGALAAYWYARYKKINPLPGWRQDPHFWFWFIPISIGQQFVFFGFLQSRLDQFLPTVLAVAFSAVMFASAHAMYRPRGRTLVMTFCGGLGFAVLYAVMPNLIAGSIAHMILNVVAVQRNVLVFLAPSQNGSV